MSKDFHISPFDSGTLLKLDLFKSYLSEWVPVFLRASNYYTSINIIDFFAGPGKDSKGIYGSPLIIIQEILKYSNDIKEKNLNVNIILNENNKNKFQKLTTEINDFKDLPTVYLPDIVTIENCISNEEFIKAKTVL